MFTRKIRTYKQKSLERKNYLDYYDQESIELVNLVYKDDFEIFDYEMIKIDKND